MKVLLAVPYFHPQTGGLENYVLNIASQLRRNGWDVVVVCSDAAVKSVIRETMNGYVVYRLPVWRVWSNTPTHPRWLSMLKQIVRAERPDLINAHIPVPYMGDLAVLAARRIPTVVTYHAGSMRKHRGLVDLPIAVYESLVLPLTLGRARAVICSSDFVRLSFLRRWRSKSVTVTPAVDGVLFRPGHELRTPGRLVFVGDHRDPRKGLDILLRAMRRLPDVELHVLGPGDNRPEVNVEYLGTVRGPELVREIQLAQALVLPSTTDAESFGMVLIEAMACGTPVVASRVGGVGGVVRDGVDGILVPPSDVDALAAAIKRIVRDAELVEAMGAAGRRRARDEFDWTARGSATSEVFMQAAARGPRPKEIGAASAK